MKKFINSVETVEDEMIQGLVKAYPKYLKKIDGHNVIVRANKKEGKVALISGGGSGHEPAHDELRDGGRDGRDGGHQGKAGRCQR